MKGSKIRAGGVLVAVAATLAACGGGGGGGDGPGPVTSGRSSLVPVSCTDGISEDSTYLNCLRSTWSGTTADGAACGLSWNGSANPAVYTGGGASFVLNSTDFQRALYQNGTGGLLAAAYWKDGRVIWTLNVNQNTIEVSQPSTNATSSCRLGG